MTAQEAIEALISRGWTIRQIAESTASSVATISAIRRGVNEAPIHVNPRIMRLAASVMRNQA